jgi:site-specific DNA recombinase
MENKFIAFYLRHSKNLEPLENQVKTLDDLRVKRCLSWEEIKVCSDVGSGKSATRIGLEQMYQYIQSSIISEVVVRDLSRVFRDFEQFGKFLKLLEKYNVKFTSIKENIDTTSAMGKAMLMIVAVLAQLERELIIERTLDGLARAKASGKKLGRPLGRKDSRKRPRAGYYLRSRNKKTSVLDQV